MTPVAYIHAEDPTAVVKDDGWTSVSGPLRWRPSDEIRSDWPTTNSAKNKDSIPVYDALVAGKLPGVPIEIAYRWVRTWTKDRFGQDLAEARWL